MIENIQGGFNSRPTPPPPTFDRTSLGPIFFMLLNKLKSSPATYVPRQSMPTAVGMSCVQPRSVGSLSPLSTGEGPPKRKLHNKKEKN